MVSQRPMPDYTVGCWFSKEHTIDEGLVRYEDTHIPIEHGKEPCAFGHGRDFAYGVLAMGGTAEQAVQVANKYSVDCGIGVALYSLDKCV